MWCRLHRTRHPYTQDELSHPSGIVHRRVFLVVFPQVLVNVPGDASRLGPRTEAAVRRAEAQLGGDGRILVRPSGTEPTIRLMIQARDAALAERVIGQLAEEVRRALAVQ